MSTTDGVSLEPSAQEIQNAAIEDAQELLGYCQGGQKFIAEIASTTSGYNAACLKLIEELERLISLQKAKWNMP